MQPDKRYLDLGQTLLSFSVLIPSQMVPGWVQKLVIIFLNVFSENFLGSNLFENLEIYLNHELITTKSSDSDYVITDMIFLRENYNGGNFKTENAKT